MRVGVPRLTHDASPHHRQPLLRIGESQVPVERYGRTVEASAPESRKVRLLLYTTTEEIDGEPTATPRIVRSPLSRRGR